MTAACADALVLFGATGDLAYKKIFPALQSMTKCGELEVPIIGVSRGGWSLDTLRKRVHDSLAQQGEVNKDDFSKLAARLDYVDGDYNDVATYARLKQALRSAQFATWCKSICCRSLRCSQWTRPAITPWIRCKRRSCECSAPCARSR